MLYFSRTFLTRLFLLLFLYPAAGCHSATEEVLPVFNNYTFNPKVIEKLPVYDSLVYAIIEKLPLFQKNINEKDSYQAFRYMPASKEADVFRKLPLGAGTDIDCYFTKLGKNFIYAFDVFKDSTIKIYIRNTPSETNLVDIEENLSYYSAGRNIRQRKFPVKDTMLNKNWQYWSRFNKQLLF